MDNDLIPEELRKIEVYAADLSSATDELSYAVAEFNGSMNEVDRIKEDIRKLFEECTDLRQKIMYASMTVFKQVKKNS